MPEPRYFAAKQVYASEKGIHIEFASAHEAKECYEDGRSRGIISNELDGNTMLKPFKKKKPAAEKEQP